MKHRITFINLPRLTVFLVLASISALASSTWYVDGVHGKNKNDCKTPQTACKTIRHAISLASSGDSIKIAAATYTENLAIGLSLKVIGSGAVTTIIDGGGNGTVVTISNASAHIALSMVTIRNGLAGAGGGINNGGTLTINNSTVSGNSAFMNCGICDSEGGGIYNSGTLRLIDSTISGNGASAHCVFCTAQGGGIENYGTLTISHSTLNGNRVFVSCSKTCIVRGGGIENERTLTIDDSTFSGNFGGGFRGSGGGIENYGTLTISHSTLSGNLGIFAGAIGNYGTATLQNSIVANSQGLGNCGGTMTSNGYNLSSDNSCNFSGTGDLNNTDPKLGALGNYGGPTQTIPLLSGSPAIDAGNPGGCTNGQGHLLKTDQRGKPRPDKEDIGGCDMGAYERQKD